MRESKWLVDNLKRLELGSPIFQPPQQQQPGQLLACLQGDPAALSECSLAQLYR